MGRIHTAAILGAASAALAIAIRKNLRRRREICFAGRVALITGGSRGLGIEIARLLAAEGAKIAIVARDADELRRAREELEARGAEVFAEPYDLTDRAAVGRIVGDVERRLGKVDVLINAAGTIEVGPQAEMLIEDYERAMAVHFWAPLILIQEVVPGMRARRRGRIVNVSSIGGKVAIPHLAPYCASKFALVGLSEALRSELAADGIFVTTAAPGLMRTGSHLHARFKGQNTKEYAWFSIANATPLLSVNSRDAARDIVEACRFGDPEVCFPMTAQAAAALNGLFPALGADILSVI
ncbi:MAG TPA: SDR family oxidoreductase, partial [Chthonomonadaceae bacterium]|nr:SDR family oxidoreductase [Chthonomonadaceae bacterium]